MTDKPTKSWHRLKISLKNCIPTEKWQKLLWLIILFSTVLRLWNFDFDNNYDNTPFTRDANHKIKQAMEVASGDTCPHRDGQIYFKQPYLLIYTSAAIIRLFGLQDPSEFATVWHYHPLYTISFSVFTILLMYHLSIAIFQNKRLALLSALLAGIIPVDVIGSRYFKEDVPLMFFMNLALLLMIYLINKKSPRLYILTGIAIGLAVATKLTALMLIPYYISAHIIAVIKAGEKKSVRSWCQPAFILSFVCLLATFLAFNPYIIIKWKEFCIDMTGQLEYSSDGHAGTSILAGDYLWGFYLIYAIVPGISLPLTLLSLFGIATSTIKKNIAAIFVAVWIFFYYLSMESSPAKPFPFFARYLQPIFPLLCIFASYFAIFVYDNLCRSAREKRLLISLVIICIFVPLAKTVLVNASLSNDTRIIATQWIDDNLPEGSCIGIDTPPYGPRPSRSKFTVFAKWRMYNTSFKELEKENTDYIVLNNFKTDRFNYCFKNSSSARKAYNYYKKVDTRYKLVKTITPNLVCQTYGFHNPIIKIYRIPDNNPK